MPHLFIAPWHRIDNSTTEHTQPTNMYNTLLCVRYSPLYVMAFLLYNMQNMFWCSFSGKRKAWIPSISIFTKEKKYISNVIPSQIISFALPSVWLYYCHTHEHTSPPSPPPLPQLNARTNCINWIKIQKVKRPIC